MSIVLLFLASWVSGTPFNIQHTVEEFSQELNLAYFSQEFNLAT